MKYNEFLVSFKQPVHFLDEPIYSDKVYARNQKHAKEIILNAYGKDTKIDMILDNGTKELFVYNTTANTALPSLEKADTDNGYDN